MYSGNLVVGGYFTNAGGRPAASIARWDGTAWWPLGPGISDGLVYALLPFGSNLVVGGGFHTAGGNPARSIAPWNGTTWAPMSSGITGEVQSLANYYGTLIAGGYFTLACGQPANYIAAWNGTSWQPLGSGMNGYVGALVVYNGDLIAGGGFTEAGGNPAGYIARWDGTAWSPLGTGLNWAVACLTVYNGDLIAGGVFTMAGGDSAYAVARWDDPAIGACCHADGSCTVTTQVDCTLPSTWQGSCTTCNPNPCPAGWGACCLPGSGCVQVSPATCQQNGGTFLGYGVSCSTDPCPTSSVRTGEVARFLRPEAEPNPSGGPTTIRYGLAAPGEVVLDVLDVSGRQIRRLVKEREDGGVHSISWDTFSDAGRPVPSGIYMIRLVAGPGVLSNRVLLIR